MFQHLCSALLALFRLFPRFLSRCFLSASFYPHFPASACLLFPLKLPNRCCLHLFFPVFLFFQHLFYQFVSSNKKPCFALSCRSYPCTLMLGPCLSLILLSKYF